MSTFGYLFLLAGILLIRQVVTGRTKDTPTDARDIALAFLNANPTGISEVLARRGENVTASSTGEVATGDDAVTPETYAQSEYGHSLVKEMMRLGNAASGYRLGATGPQYFDCSGLVWKAVKNLGVFGGARFTTHNFSAIARGWAYTVPSPTVGDIVLWPTHHIGVYLGNDKMYSARSRAKGIGESTVSGDSSYFGSQPIFYRVANASRKTSPNGAI